MQFRNNDTFGNDGTTTPVSVTVNAGGIVSSNGFCTTLPTLNLNDSELRVNGRVNASFPAYQLRNVNVGGTSASQITTTGTPNSGIALGFTGGDVVTFNVADATKSPAADLTVSASLRNSAKGSQTSGLTKTGAGKMVLTAANSYTGPTTIAGGSLIVSGAGNISASSSVTVANTGTLGGDGRVSNILLRNGGTAAPGIYQWVFPS